MFKMFRHSLFKVIMCVKKFSTLFNVRKEGVEGRRDGVEGRWVEGRREGVVCRSLIARTELCPSRTLR